MNLKNIKPKIRYVAEMDSVLYDREWLKDAFDLKLYYMYRDLAENEEDKKKAIKENLRYDITILPSIMLGTEYNKTAGHSHPIVPQTSITYPEIYEVLSGKAIFLLQDTQGGEVNNVYAVEAKKNDKIVIPPNYEHLMINASAQELKTANWVCRGFTSNIYEMVREKRGFCYYAIKDEMGKINWIKNKNYASIPALEFSEPNLGLEKFGITKKEKLYNLIKTPEKLNFLKIPQDYDWK
ncbi:MAG: glucose-6-phosphate isomerase family protein [Patescibacteria group bacterium]|nr:glucose-6-phosphate isomerase family protein [Patescibacteria group bacterium]